MTHPNNYDMPSADIAKQRLINMKSSDTSVVSSQAKAKSNTDKYIQNPIHIDNNLLWEENHNVLSSKGD